MVEEIKNLMRKGFFHIFGSSVINKCITFMSSIVLVHILSKTEYGIFTYAWNIYSLLMLMNGLGSESAVLQVCSENYNDKEYTEKVTSFGTKVGSSFNLLLCLMLIIIGIFMPLPIGNAKRVLMSLCLLPLFQYLYNLSLVILRYRRENKGYSKIAIINTAVLFVSSLLFAYLFREIGLAIGYYIAFIISIAVAIKQYKIHYYNKNSLLDTKSKTDFMKIALVSMSNNGLSQLLYLLDVFILGIMFSDSSILASYKIATTIPTALTFIPQAVITYVYSEFANNNTNGDWCIKHYRKIIKYIGLMNFAISGVLFIFSDFIICNIFGNQYLDAGPVFRILVVNYFISGTFRIISGNLLVTQRKLKFNFFVALLSGIVNIIFDCLFISLWGSIGAAMATISVVIISSICSTAYLIYTFNNLKAGLEE